LASQRQLRLLVQAEKFGRTSGLTWVTVTQQTEIGCAWGPDAALAAVRVGTVISAWGPVQDTDPRQLGAYTVVVERAP
jgi:hypothetical protein